MRFYQLSAGEWVLRTFDKGDVLPRLPSGPNNLAGGMKVLWDAMVAAGYLFDDGPKFLERDRPGQVQMRKKRDEKTVVTVTVY